MYATMLMCAQTTHLSAMIHAKISPILQNKTSIMRAVSGVSGLLISHACSFQYDTPIQLGVTVRARDVLLVATHWS
jgi:hypothetical protein